MTRAEILDEIRNLLGDVPIDRSKRTRIEPMLDKKKYRGKDWVVGYSWMRPSSPYHGMCYDCVLGWGDSPELALADAKVRIYSRSTKEE